MASSSKDFLGLGCLPAAAPLGGAAWLEPGSGEEAETASPLRAAAVFANVDDEPQVTDIDAPPTQAVPAPATPEPAPTSWPLAT